MKPWLLLTVVVAASLAGCLERVDARIYAQNATDKAERIHVVILDPDGKTIVDEEAVIATSSSESTLLGHIRGAEGTYHWSVEFGDRTAEKDEPLEDHVVTMNVHLLPDGLDVGFSLA